jgi:hypothetical protein
MDLMPDLLMLEPARVPVAFEPAVQPTTQIELHIGRPSTADPDIAHVRSGSLTPLLRDSVEAATLAVVLDDSKLPVGEIGEIERTIPQLESLSEVAIRTKRALDPHEVSSLAELRRGTTRQMPSRYSTGRPRHSVR